MAFRNRRAIGGLISLIGIIVVFGITSVAYLELSSSQTRLINTSILTNQRMSDQTNEHLNFTSITSMGIDYDIQVENIGSKPITIHSFIIDRNKSLVGKGEIDSKIQPGDVGNISTGLISGTPISNEDNLIFTTSFGKRCIIPADVSFRIC
jgi:hypothetical protein